MNSGDQCPTCGTGFILPSLYCDHCNTYQRKPEAVADHADSPPQNTLLPCPFCGDCHVTVSEYDAKDAWWTQCDNIYCGAEGPTRKTEQAARQAWNQRGVLSPSHEGAFKIMEQSFLEEQAQHEETKRLLAEAKAAALHWKGLAHSPTPPSPQVEQVSAVQESVRDETPATDVSAGDAQGQDALTLEFLATMHDALEVAFIAGCHCGGKSNPNWRSGHAGNCSARYFGKRIEEVGAMQLRVTSVGRGNENHLADQVAENPCAVQGQWTVVKQNNLAWIKCETTGAVTSAREATPIFLDMLKEVCIEHNASLKDDSKTDWLGAASTDCICHRGKGWVCPIHGDVETALRKLLEAVSSPVPQASEVEEEKKQILGGPGAINSK